MRTQRFLTYIFSCCSDVLSVMEMSEAIAADLKYLETEGAQAYDVHL